MIQSPMNITTQPQITSQDARASVTRPAQGATSDTREPAWRFYGTPLVWVLVVALLLAATIPMPPMRSAPANAPATATPSEQDRDKKIADEQAKKLAEAQRAKEQAKKLAEAQRAKEQAKKLAEARRAAKQAKKLAGAKRAKEHANKVAGAKRAEAAHSKVRRARPKGTLRSRNGNGADAPPPVATGPGLGTPDSRADTYLPGDDEGWPPYQIEYPLRGEEMTRFLRYLGARIYITEGPDENAPVLAEAVRANVPPWDFVDGATVPNVQHRLLTSQEAARIPELRLEVTNWMPRERLPTPGNYHVKIAIQREERLKAAVHGSPSVRIGGIARCKPTFDPIGVICN